jgi:RsiW-degrading membrane proteinase PrsW (M82 family)
MWTLVSGVIALVVVAIGARPVGRALKARPIAWYVAANALVFLLALAIVVASTMIAVPSSAPTSDALYGAGIGLGFGGLAGLRYGYKGLFETAARKERA